MTTKIPAGYRRPDQAVLRERTTNFWITEFDNRPGTTVYTVSGVDGDGQHIIAEKCYLHWAIRIVDGLRATT